MDFTPLASAWINKRNWTIDNSEFEICEFAESKIELTPPPDEVKSLQGHFFLPGSLLFD